MKESILHSKALNFAAETSESIYWLSLLQKVYKTIDVLPNLLQQANEIKAMLIKSLNTSKSQ